VRLPYKYKEIEIENFDSDCPVVLLWIHNEVGLSRNGGPINYYSVDAACNWIDRFYEEGRTDLTPVDPDERQWRKD
jgi:hypothetical protein